jgi:hypothetical protein
MALEQEFRQESRDVWSHGSGQQLRDLLASSLSTLLLLEGEKHAYFSSPWVSDFILFENHYGQFNALFPEFGDQTEIRFSDYLVCLAKKLPVRIITTSSEVSVGFRSHLELRSSAHIQVRTAPDEYHEKGILAPSFYIEGSMNITYSGVYVRGEKVTYHSARNPQGASKISAAYLEYDRRWNILK